MDYYFDIGYRHGNGEVEGFSGFASTTAPGAKGVAAAKAMARERAVGMAREKASGTPWPFDAARVIESDKGLTAAERKTLREDWKAMKRSGT